MLKRRDGGLSVGIDLIEISEVRYAAERFGARYLTRVYTQGELRDCGAAALRYAHLAARFAAKEAAYKALGSDGPLTPLDIEVRRSPAGAPQICFGGRFREAWSAARLGPPTVSMSHSGGHAIAAVVAQRISMTP